MKKILLASGDSWTDQNFRSAPHPEMDVSWPKWPEILAKHLDMEVINLGKCGQDNIETYESIQDAVIAYGDDVGFVAVGWTHANRRGYQRWNSNLQCWEVDNSQYGKITGFRLKTHVKNTVRLYMNIQILCERYNIPYLQAQIMLLFPRKGEQCYQPFWMEDDYLEGENHEETALRELYNYDGIIDDARFLGWPPTPALNGWSMMDKYITPESGMTISEYDAHPNKEGQEKIAEAFIIRSILLKCL